MREEKKNFESNYTENMEAKDIKFKKNHDYKESEESTKATTSESKKVTSFKFDGRYYDGEILDDKPHGAGVMHYKDGVLKGTWFHGVLDGVYSFHKDNKVFMRTYEKGVLKR